MNGKLIINTNLLRKEPEYRTNSCVVEKAAAVSHAGFESLKSVKRHVKHKKRENPKKAVKKQNTPYKLRIYGVYEV